MRKRQQTSEFDVEEAIIEPETKLFNSQDYQTFPQGNHVWRQQGPYIICKECPLHHAIYVGMERLLVGIDDKGNPILKNRSVIESGNDIANR